jgi:hypothetical protein
MTSGSDGLVHAHLIGGDKPKDLLSWADVEA